MRILLLLHLLLLPPLALSMPLGGGEFYHRGQEGWFWYRDPPPEPEPMPEPAAPPVPPPASPPEESVAEAVEPEGPAPLSVAWLKAKIPEYRTRAIDNPTKENISAYMYLQRLAMDKASRYAEMTQRVVMADPYLDESLRRPLSTYAVHALNKDASDHAVSTIKALAKRAGIAFFFRSDCPHCHRQAPVLEQLERLYGFKILPISLDGLPLPGGLFPRYKTDRGQAAALGVIATPAMFLLAPPNEFAPIGQGAMAASEIIKRILVTATERGWINERQLADTRPIRPAPALDTASASGSSVPDEVLSNPALLVEYLRRNASLPR